uniref:Conserved hypothetical phage protein n=1 Tax=Arsenophonus nasoniae TaxID=638 RepID=D2U4M3_9GAMM|nr:conserved hypothetical phage protein [Arsenophonus nasoniae]
MRKSHEVADVATKADIIELKRDIADVRKDMEIVRKDLQLEMSGIRAEQKLMRWMLGAGILGILSLVVKAFLMPAL